MNAAIGDSDVDEIALDFISVSESSPKWRHYILPICL